MSLNRQIEIYLENQNFGRCVALFAIRRDMDGRMVEVAEPTRFQRVDPGPGDVIPMLEPSMAMLSEHAQSLMDQLWRLGFRPEGGRQSEGVVNATQKHLQDMRAIAFGKLKLELPK